MNSKLKRVMTEHPRPNTGQMDAARTVEDSVMLTMHIHVYGELRKVDFPFDTTRDSARQV